GQQYRANGREARRPPRARSVARGDRDPLAAPDDRAREARARRRARLRIYGRGACAGSFSDRTPEINTEPPVRTGEKVRDPGRLPLPSAPMIHAHLCLSEMINI